MAQAFIGKAMLRIGQLAGVVWLVCAAILLFGQDLIEQAAHLKIAVIAGTLVSFPIVFLVSVLDRRNIRHEDATVVRRFNKCLGVVAVVSSIPLIILAIATVAMIRF